MNRWSHTRSSLVASLAALTMVMLSACSSGSVGSRHEIYDSFSALNADSTAVVEVQVEDRNSVAAGEDSSAYTAATVVVVAAVQPPDLAESAVDMPSRLEEGSTVVIRQMGEPGTQADTPYLEPGNRYLVFLTPTQLPNAAANEFYITGAVAGIYKADADGFVRSSQDGDRIPEILTLKDLE